MDEPEQFIACRCVECGVPGDVPIKAAVRGWWPRHVGWVVGAGIVVMWTAPLLLRGPTVTPIGPRGASGYNFIDPVVTAEDLRAVVAGDPASRERIVETVREFRRRWRAEYPFSEETIALEVLPADGKWLSTESFGRPTPWLTRLEEGTVTPGITPGPAVWLTSFDAWRVGPRFQVDQSYTTPVTPKPAIILGSLATIGVASLALGFLASRLARRRRRAVLMTASAGSVIACLAWSIAAGTEQTCFFGNPAFPAALPLTNSVLLTPAEFADPALTDAAIAARLLESTPFGDDGYLAFASIPEYTWCNSSMDVYGRRTWVLVVERVSFARLSDPGEPIALPARGWDVTLSGDYLSLGLPAGNSPTVIRRVSFSLAPIALVALGAIAAGSIVATAVRWPLLRRARSRRRDNLCIACAYPLPASV